MGYDAGAIHNNLVSNIGRALAVSDPQEKLGYLNKAKGNIENLKNNLDGIKSYIVVLDKDRKISISPDMLSPISFLIAGVTIDNMRGRCVQGAARNSVYSNVVREVNRIMAGLDGADNNIYDVLYPGYIGAEKILPRTVDAHVAFAFHKEETDTSKMAIDNLEKYGASIFQEEEAMKGLSSLFVGKKIRLAAIALGRNSLVGNECEIGELKKEFPVLFSTEL